MKKTRPTAEWEEIDRWDGGVGWIAHPDETMLRASHALAPEREDTPDDDQSGETDESGGVWVVDPVDVPDVDDLFAEFGDVVGVVVLLNRHYRDADDIASRHDVPVYLPSWFDRVPAMSAPIHRFDDVLPGTDYRVLKLAGSFGWEEAALYDGTGGTLLVPESIGNAPYYTAPGERLGVHPMRRLTPPSALRGLQPNRILLGHGPGVTDDAPGALSDALRGARRRTPRLLVENVRLFLS